MPFDERFLPVAFRLFHVRRAIGHVLVSHLVPSRGNFQVAYRCDTVALVNESSAAQPAIAMRDVDVSRGAAGQVLRGLSLEIAAGETVALVGRSGAGKTTALKLINGLIVPDAGDVIIEGRSTRDWNPFELRRRIGYVLQEIGLFPHMSVAENVAIVPRLLAWEPARIEARVTEMLQLVGLAPETYAGRAATELSGGQRQRVGVARALAADPPILLMDEPFGALDPVTRAELHREFRRIQSAVHKTVVIVTHDMAEAFALATRVGVLDNGAIAQIDTPRTLARSTDPRVRPLLEPLVEAGALLS
jgi:osmoprotectant transport system ATP-binding protein